MKFRRACHIFGILVAAFLPTARLSAQTATLLVRADTECRWSVDGESKGILKVEDRVRLSLQLGEHLIEAVPVSGGVHWEKTIRLLEPRSEILTITMKGAGVPLAAANNAANSSFWIDPDTHLMWAKKDSGADVTWSEAVRFCGGLKVAGFGDWRIPTVQDLQRVYDPRAVGASSIGTEVHIKGGIKLSGLARMWGASAEDPNTVYFFDFASSFKATAGKTGSFPVICVRGTSE